uniref:Uncharacterized protein n=1 Tax=Strigops habroptila TaxID=2489341 RepID=A0A672V5A3_STRHB
MASPVPLDAVAELWNWEAQLLGAVQCRVKVKRPFLSRNMRKHIKNHLENLTRAHLSLTQKCFGSTREGFCVQNPL